MPELTRTWVFGILIPKFASLDGAVIEIDLSDAPLPFEGKPVALDIPALIQRHPILFLDIDGVMRPDGPSDNRLDPACVQRLNGLAAHLDARIVISSTWRWVWSKERFNAALEGRVIGMTPDVPQDPRGEAPERWQEIQAWIGIYGQPRRFLALDDKPKGFPRGCAHVHYTQPKTGLVDADVEAIARRMTAGD